MTFSNSKPVETIKPQHIDDTTPKSIQLSYCAAERYQRIKARVDATPRDAPAPITYEEALFALDYVANDTTVSPELRRDARETRCTIISHIRARMAAEQNGGQA